MINNIIIEKPISWIESEDLGDYVKIFYNNLLDILNEYNIDLNIIDIFYAGCDSGLDYNRTPKFNFNNTLYLSYHTYGGSLDNLWRIKESYLPGFFSLDKKGYSGFSSFSDLTINELNLDKIDYNLAYTYIHNIRNKLIKENKSKYIQNKLNINVNHFNNCIFFPLQVQNDTVVDLSRMNFYELINEVCYNIDLPIIIKPHPFSIDKDKLNTTLNQIIKDRSNVHVSYASIHQILPRAACCITINSGVGFEALMYGKPVLTFGKSDYHIATYNYSNLHQINNKLINECILNHNNINTIRFLYLYLNNYCMYYTNIEDMKSKINNILI
jgi:hypothetical protein